ncbi:SufE family protein [Roseofilum casamattae]|uniref:SufE family protein n=1 Tax=Roseofilum casamattae BLCC-M143 TaxID=3022442 RepID=A0ABT7C300_9CYAN|nr:SufE family protein [Roseofilum casamattae]MDJ1185838.1 SufE family protein [Roseofilum casamattae BLCC-M143]
MTETTQSLPANLEKIVKRFQRYQDPKRRIQQLIDYAKKLPEFPESSKIDENKVPGCVSQVFITANLEEGLLQYQADSDAQLTKGLVSLLVFGLNGLPPEEVINLSSDFIQDTGLNVNLTPSRANGFYNIFETMKKKARELQIE